MRPGSRFRRLILLGTYDAWRNRNRVLLEGLRDRGWEVRELNAPAFTGTDRGQLGRAGLLRAALLHLVAWLGLAWRYLREPPHRAVLVGHLGPVDAPFAWLLSRLRGARLVCDLGVPLAEAALDRGLVRPGSLPARLLALADSLTVRLSWRVLGDTACHNRALSRTWRWPRKRWLVVPVGASDRVFAPAAGDGEGVLFYGHYLRLQGAPTIVQAAARWPRGIPLLCVGKGDERARCEALAAGLPHVRFADVLPYPALVEAIRKSALVLGIFGATAKAARVVPNKVYEALAAGRPVVTADGPATRELLPPGAVRAVPPGDPEALAAAVVALMGDPEARRKLAAEGHRVWRERFRPRGCVRALDAALRVKVGSRPTRETP